MPVSQGYIDLDGDRRACAVPGAAPVLGQCGAEVVKLSGLTPERFSLQARQPLGKDPGIGIGLGEGQPHPTGRNADPCPHLQQLAPQGGALSAGQLGALGAACSKWLHPYIGEGGDVQAQLVRAHPLRAGAVGEQVELRLFDAGLPVAARRTASRTGAWQRPDEWEDGSPRSAGSRPWSDPPPCPPRVGCGSTIFASRPRSPGIGGPPCPGKAHPGPDRAHQALVARQSQDRVDAVVLAPAQDRFAAKARTTPDADARVGPVTARGLPGLTEVQALQGARTGQGVARSRAPACPLSRPLCPPAPGIAHQDR